jgi:hypothetical protein
VRTLTHNFAQVKAFFFKGHSWSQLNGRMYDATTKVMGFAQKTDLYWCQLGITAKSQGESRAFMITRQVHPAHLPLSGNPPYACVSTVSLKEFRQLFPVVWTAPGAPGVTQGFINTLPDTSGSGNWATFVVVSRDHLPMAYRQAAGPL